MALVAWVSYRAARREADTQEGYFLAGRGLGALFIAGSMLLTNLSAEQLVGLNGSAYGYNLSSMAWEVTAAFATIAMAFVFLPKYLAGAFTTLPEFLRSRYDDSLRRWTVLLFMVGYGLVTIPSVLYAGSLAVLQLFDLPLLLDIGRGSALVLTIWTIGLVGSAYAIFGGMRAIAVSDTLNGMGLLVMGLAIPLLGLRLLGEGDIVTGAVIIATEESHKLNAIGGSNDPTPFATLFTGMLLANLFYWCTNQYVIQRTLSARSLAEGQKGVLLSGFFKVMVPLIMMLPGVIAYHLYWGEGAASGLSSMDLAYPQLVRDVLPGWAQGLFLAVLMGAVFSSFNSLLNSAATLLCLDVYAPLRARRGHRVDDEEMIRIAKRAGLGIAIVSFIIAPLLQYAPDGLWQLIRIFTGFYNIPVIAIVLFAMFAKRTSPEAAKAVIVFHVIAYGLMQFVFKETLPIHFLHHYAVLFVIELGILFIGARRQRAERPWMMDHADSVDLTPWPFALPCAVSLGSCVVGLYLLFSPIGLVGGLSFAFWPLMSLLITLNAGLWLHWIYRVARLDYSNSG